MKHDERAESKSGSRWLIIPALVFAVFVVYFSGAVAARVLYVRGVLRDGSGTLDFVETAFTPMHSLYSRSPAFKAGFDWCAGLFLPKQKDTK